MADNTYRITLYNNRFFSEMLTYKFPLLPAVGDMVEIINGQTMFVVQSRSFQPYYEAGLIDVTLYGVIENCEEMSQHPFDKILAGIRKNQEQLATMDWTKDNRILNG